MKIKKLGKIKKDKKNPKEQSILINLVIDRSSSMGFVQDAVISGFNEFIATQKDVPGNAEVSLTFFSEESALQYVGCNIADVEDFTKASYVPNGMTALNDAVADSIERVTEYLNELKKKDRPDKVLFVVYTDGEENSSKRTTTRALKALIEKHSKKWEFVFLGANQNAWAAGGNIGVRGATHTMSFDHTPGAHSHAWTALSGSTTSYRGMADPVAVNYFNQEDVDTRTDKKATPAKDTTTSD